MSAKSKEIPVKQTLHWNQCLCSSELRAAVQQSQKRSRNPNSCILWTRTPAGQGAVLSNTAGIGEMENKQTGFSGVPVPMEGALLSAVSCCLLKKKKKSYTQELIESVLHLNWQFLPSSQQNTSAIHLIRKTRGKKKKRDTLLHCLCNSPDMFPLWDLGKGRTQTFTVLVFPSPSLCPLGAIGSAEKNQPAAFSQGRYWSSAPTGAGAAVCRSCL